MKEIVEVRPMDLRGDSTSDVGARLKMLRDMYGLSQRELAKRARVTNGSVSLIELNEVSPSVASLKKILCGFPMSLAEFFALEVKPHAQVFYQAGELTERGSGLISLRQVGGNLSGRKLQMVHECYEAGADTGETMMAHAGEEAGIVVSGRIEITVGSRRKVLQPGEAYYFNSRIPHRFRNAGPESCVLVTAGVPTGH
jgi:transcriptional regulator with XRE-family HTH domain